MLALPHTSQCKNNSIQQTKLIVRRSLRKKEYCRTSYDTCNENYKKEEMWRKKSENRERAKKTLGDLSSLRTKCEGNAKGSLLLVTAEYQLLSAVDITARRARGKKKRKTIHETRETSRTIFATRGTLDWLARVFPIR